MRSLFRGGGQEWLWLLLSATLFACALLLPLRCALGDEPTREEQRLWEAYQQGEIIRLHVVAHSDSPEDQALKLAVRDAVIDRFGQLLSGIGAMDFEQANAVLKGCLSDIRLTAENCALQHGFKGVVTVQAGLMQLPAKRYGSIILPAGEYHALRITLGSGQGQNWWCVLYPQLCLALAQEGTESEDAIVWRSERIWRQWLALPV